jgi:hypothetical protein
LYNHENDPEPMFFDQDDKDEDEYNAPGYFNGVSQSAKKRPVGKGMGRAQKRPSSQ